jgi:hypothetical protein
METEIDRSCGSSARNGPLTEHVWYSSEILDNAMIGLNRIVPFPTKVPSLGQQGDTAIPSMRFLNVKVSCREDVTN